MKNGGRYKVLFAGEGVTLAHVGRPLRLASSLDESRYEIHFASSERYRKLAEPYGFTFHALPTLAPDSFMRRLAAGVTLYDRDTLRAYVESEVELLETLNPDLVVGDFRVSLGISASATYVPYANLCNAHWSPYSSLSLPVPELPVTRLLGAGAVGMVMQALEGPVMRLQARPYNAVRDEWGLNPVSGIREMYSGGTWTLYADLPELAPTQSLPAYHSYIGPVTWSPEIALPDWWADVRARGLPVIYVTMGSSGDTRVVRDLLDVLASMPVSVAFATAGRFEAGDLPANVHAADYLPGKAMLKESALCIFNGGSATGYQALTEGVPLLGFPSNADQFFFMEGVERIGAGMLLRPSRTGKRQIRAALGKMMGDDQFLANASGLKRRIQQLDSGREFQSFMERAALSARIAAAEFETPGRASCGMTAMAGADCTRSSGREL